MAGKCSEGRSTAIGAVKEYRLRGQGSLSITAVIPGWPAAPDPESMNTGESFFRIVGTILELAAAGFIDVGQDDHSKVSPELLVFYRN
jgi:hypothetical protein